MATSSLKAEAKDSISARIVFIMRCKTAGVPARPNGITVNWYFPNDVTKAVLCLEAGSTGTCQ